jgi:hypothetical protein
MADSQVPWGVDALGGSISEPAWQIKPSWYLVATEDRMIPPPAQRAMSGRAGSTVVEVAGSHAIYLSQQAAVAALIEQAAAAAAAGQQPPSGEVSAMLLQAWVAERRNERAAAQDASRRALELAGRIGIAETAPSSPWPDSRDSCRMSIPRDKLPHRRQANC